MAAPKKMTGFDVEGEMISLSAGDLKKVQKYIEVLKTEKTALQKKLEIQKKIYEIQVKQATARTKDTRALKEDTKVNQERLVILESIKDQLDKVHKAKGQEIADYYKSMVISKGPRVPLRAHIPMNRRFTPPAAPAMYEIDQMMKASRESSTSVGTRGRSADQPKKKGAFEGIKEGILIGIGFKIVGLLEKGLQGSRHIQLIGSSIQKAISLMIDLLLLPFLPVIASFIILMYKLILGIYGIMHPKGGGTPEDKAHQADINRGKSLATLGGLLPIDLPTLMAMIASVIIGALIAALLLSVGVSAGWAIVAGVIVGILTYFVTEALINWAYAAGAEFGHALANAWDAFMKADWVGKIKIALGMFVTLLTDAFLALAGPFGLVVAALLTGSVIDAIGNTKNSLVKTIGDIWAWAVQGIQDFIRNPLESLKSLVTSTFTWIADTVKSILSNILKWIASYIPGVGTLSHMIGFAEGGVVPGPVGSPVPAIVHGGEKIIPAGESSGGNTFNFYGLTDSQLQDKIRTVLRQEGARHFT